ncbi:MAG: hypothetical protein CVU56_11225 [Deltaproteobacteria bacterium HGW-Deltaproteobacteria-14]|jgi:hypothetical protein|nr:MAG: hypothetical protein CVU56_11225 [Deltaproteobacteria bacterium HGW-Deltaproteobacteria-14]
MRALSAATSAALLLLAVETAHAYPEFEQAIEKNAGRTIDCAFCHINPDGPEGTKVGQIGSLSPAEFQALNRARTAFEPGAQVESPILNAFGNHLVTVYGKKKIVALRADPLALAAGLGDSDLDGDGVSDAQELLDGTHPLMSHHGNPWRLLGVNLQRAWFELIMLVLATLFGVYGISHLIRWFGHEARSALGGDEESKDG